MDGVAITGIESGDGLDSITGAVTDGIAGVAPDSILKLHPTPPISNGRLSRRTAERRYGASKGSWAPPWRIPVVYTICSTRGAS
jgi:hypothetical protein